MNSSIYIDHLFHLSYKANASCLHGISSMWQVKQQSWCPQSWRPLQSSWWHIVSHSQMQISLNSQSLGQRYGKNQPLPHRELKKGRERHCSGPENTRMGPVWLLPEIWNPCGQRRLQGWTLGTWETQYGRNSKDATTPSSGEIWKFTKV